MTCTELYACSDTFRSAIAKWVADLQCPVQLADFLRECDANSNAIAAVEYALSVPVRPLFSPEEEEPDSSGLFPLRGNRRERVEWWVWGTWPEYSHYSHAIPSNQQHVAEEIETYIHSKHGDRRKFKCPESAILYLLDHWTLTPQVVVT